MEDPPACLPSSAYLSLGENIPLGHADHPLAEHTRVAPPQESNLHLHCVQGSGLWLQTALSGNFNPGEEGKKKH